MARRTVTILTDDFDGTESDDVSSVSFALNGKTYSIDLGPKNRSKLEKAFAPYVEKAIRTGGPVRRSSGSRSSRDLSPVREWAQANGHKVGDRGRIPASVIEAYDAAH